MQKGILEKKNQKKQISLIESPDMSSQNWWKLLKNLIGPDMIHPSVFKAAVTTLKYPFTELFNRNLYTHYFPDICKTVNVILIYKNKLGPYFPANFRPMKSHGML